jgi:hypothetical protein
MIRAGWAMTILFTLFMLGASVAPKLLGMAAATESMTQIGWPTDYLLLIGSVELVLTVLFLIPRTALLAAILFMGLLGGALASHLRAGSPLFGYTLFSVYLGTFMWVALWLRDPELRKVLPLRR